MLKVAIVFLGGGVGSAARYLLGGKVQTWLGPSFPSGTLAVNVLGSFTLALLMALSLRTTWLSAETRLLLTTGFCGGFTTYSTFNYETLALAQSGAYGTVALNIGATVLACLVAGALGFVAARVLAG